MREPRSLELLCSLQGSSNFYSMKKLFWRHSQSSYSPVTSTFLSSFNEQRQANEVDSRSNSQGANEFENKAHQPREAQDNLDKRGHQDGSLDL